MTKLRKFRTLEDKINLGLKIFCCLLILTIIVMGKSLAEYKQEAEVTFIRARVGKFKTNDIQLAMLLDGEEVETPPSKDNYTVDISCDNADGSWDSDRWGANIDNIRAGKVKCEVNFSTPVPTMSEVTATSDKISISLSYTASGSGTSTTCKYGTSEGTYDNEVEGATNTNCNISGLDMDTLYYYQVCAVNGAGEVCKEGNIKTMPNYILGEHVKVGDVISMTPTSKGYTISTCVQTFENGKSCGGTINPSELNLWKVIQIREDGSVDATSLYVSTDKIWIAGEEGYMKLGKILNTVAQQYTDGVHVIKTRHFGYDLLAGKDEVCVSNTFAACNTDTQYITDLKLLLKARGSSCNPEKYACELKMTPPGGEYGSFWLPSRYRISDSSWGVRYIHTSGALLVEYLLNDGEVQYAMSHSILPVVTFSPESEILAGEGKVSNPYTLK